jgi:hypothetical protein
MYSLGDLLTFPGRGAVVLGDLLVLLQILEHGDRVAAVVAGRDPEVLGLLADVLDELAAAFLGQLRDRHADHLAVVHRRQPRSDCRIAFSMAADARSCRRAG